MSTSPMEEDNPRKKVSRRNALKYISGGAIGLNFFPKIVGAERNVKIVVEETPDGQKKATKSVPKRWNDHRKRMSEVFNTLSKRHKNNGNVTSVGFRITDQWIGGHRKFKIVVHMKDVSERVTPDSIRGGSNDKDSIDRIPVETRSSRNKFEHLYGCYNTSGSWIAPGRFHYADDVMDRYGNRGDRMGSNGWIVEWNGSKYCLTANHTFVDDGECDTTGMDVYNADDEKIGTIARSEDAGDWALVDVESGFSTYDSVDEEEGNLPGSDSYSGSGFAEQSTYFGETGVSNLAASDERVWQTGTATGSTGGQILGVDRSFSDGLCINLFSDTILSTCNVSDGDSGGPLYAESSLNLGDVSICGILSGAYNNDKIDHENCRGNALREEAYYTPAWKMANSYGIDFSV